MHPGLLAVALLSAAPVPGHEVVWRGGDRLRAVLAPEIPVTEENLDRLSRALVRRHGPSGARRFEILALDARGRLVPAVNLLPPVPPVPRRAFERPRRRPLVLRSGPPHDAPGFTAGFLAGKTVYLSAGHGWVWRSDTDSWETQRGNTWGLVEDFSNAEAVNQYLLQYLVNAGALVFTVRESDLQEAMVIVDDAGPGYEESGTGFGPGDRPGFGGAGPWHGGANPMTAGGTRMIRATAAPAAVARWVPALPAAGAYNVYVSYAAGPDRAPDAHYVVIHPGGETHFRVDQRRHGNTWVPLGTFFFEAGSSGTRGALELRSDSSRAGAVLSLDAVRFGGGLGDVIRGSGTSGKRRWEEGSRYYAQFAGAPASVYDYAGSDGSDDVGCRSRYAAWQNEEGEDAIYFSWHTNAPSPGRGTSSFVYGPNPPDGSYQFTGTAGSDRLARLVHDEVIADIRAAWDPAWRDRGVFSAYFGELNPRHNPEMPAVLMEVAFHATLADAASLKEARFRGLVARAIYQGIARYFAERDGVPVQLLPEPPTHLAVHNDGPGRIRVRWRAAPPDPVGGDAAERFRLYRSADGRAWDNGTPVDGTSTVLEGLAPGTTVFVRVTAVNAGGESFPTPTLGARVAATGRAPLLLVHAFDRLDAAALVPEETPGLGTVYRMFLDRMNRYDIAVAHGRAASAAGVSYDSAHSFAVADGDVDLAPYRAVDWMAGEESTADESISAAEQARLRVFADGGGALFVSGAEVAWDLGARGDEADRAFLAEVLRAGYDADDGGSRRILPEGAFAGIDPLNIDDGRFGGYAIGFPDALLPGPGAEVAWRYDGTSRAAAILAPGVFVLGTPLEALHPEGARHALYARALALLGVADEEAPGASDGGAPDGAAPGGAAPSRAGGCSCSAGRAPGSLVLAILLVLLGRRGITGRRRGPP
jgi:N-acetylmuramoyl-L-alanine amidase